MNNAVPTSFDRATRPRRGTAALYVAEGLTSLAATWLSTGMFFVTSKLYGWDVTANLALASAQGIVYTLGALLAAWGTRRWGRRGLLITLYVTMGVLTLGMWGVSASPAVFVGVVLAWTFAQAANWPALEAMLCHSRDTGEVSRRVGAYNLCWAATGAIAIATASAAMEVGPGFLLGAATAMHLGSAWLVARGGRDADHDAGGDVHLEAPPELRRKRVLAMRLARLALPASYTVIYSLVPLLASRPEVAALDGWVQGLAVSVWMVMRVVVFWGMGVSSFWHTRPGLLMGAVVAMALAFAGAAFGFVGASAEGTSDAMRLAWLIGMQALLGVTLGVIYAGSLYFGMVLAHGGEGEGGSTEQGGYHEATIGAGTVLGPGVGALAVVAGFPATWGVGAVVVASVAVCGIAAWGARQVRVKVEAGAGT